MASDDVIVELVGRLQRSNRSGVFPWQVMYYVPFEISEGYARKTMTRLWQEGRLSRVGGTNARRGYRVAVGVSRLRVVRGEAGQLRMVA